MREIERKLILILLTNSFTSSIGSGLVSKNIVNISKNSKVVLTLQK